MADQQDATSADVDTSATEDDDTTAEELLADAVNSDGKEADAEGEDDSTPEDKPLGPAGEKALTAEKTKRREEAAKRRAAERERDEAKAELEKLQRTHKRAAAKPAAKSEDTKPADPDVEEIDPEEIRREAEQAAVQKANERIVKAEIRASAAGRLADPKDALRFLDLTKIEVDADGNVDTEEIDDAIADLLKNKPYLAVPAQSDGRRFKGSGDGGAKPSKPARPKSLGEAIVRHYEKK